MRLRRILTSYGVLLALFSVAACGGNSGSTGLPRDQPLNTLSTSDLTTACHTVVSNLSYGDDVISGMCATQLLAQGMAACNSGLADCVTRTKAQIMSTQADVNASCDRLAVSNFASCTATVGELEDCMSTEKDYIDERYSSVTCATTNPPSGTFDLFSAPACSALRTKCPNILGG